MILVNAIFYLGNGDYIIYNYIYIYLCPAQRGHLRKVCSGIVLIVHGDTRIKEHAWIKWW